MIQKIIIALGFLYSSLSLASQYPPSFFNQTVHLIHDQAAVFAKAGNAVMSHFIIGYQNYGYLAKSNPDVLDAIIITKCRTELGGEETKISTVTLGKEWHGTGYMSMPLGRYDGFPFDCTLDHNEEIEIAFSDRKGNWDSKFGKNYRLSVESFWSTNAIVYHSNQSSNSNFDINQSVWNFIINEMRKPS